MTRISIKQQNTSFKKKHYNKIQKDKNLTWCIKPGKKTTEGIATPHLLIYKTVHARCVTALQRNASATSMGRKGSTLS